MPAVAEGAAVVAVVHLVRVEVGAVVAAVPLNRRSRVLPPIPTPRRVS